MQRWARRLKRWRDDARGILQFIAEELHAKPDPWQEEVVLLFRSPDPADQRIAMQACAGPGKSAVMSWCGLWFLGTQGEPGEHPKGLATSITGENLKANLWAEYAKWMQRSDYCRAAFTWTARRIFANDHPATWFLEARTWPKTANADEQGKTFSGLHAKYVLAQADESGAIPPAVGRAAEQALSACAFGKLLQAGNPISLEGMLHEAASTLRHLWRTIRITGDPDDARAWVHSPRVQAMHRASGPCSCPTCWARQQIAAYGRENPWVMAYILGKFPPASINQLISADEVEEAMHRHLRPDTYNWAQKRLGVDVARFGDDRTVIFPRQGLAAWRPIIMRNARTTAIAARVHTAASRWGAELTLVDDTGHWGHGVIDNLLTLGRAVLPIIYSDKAIDPRYYNRRAEFWFKGCEAIKGGAALPFLPELVAELATPTYTFAKGQILVEPKDQVKARLGRSPDLADAYLQTYSVVDMPGGTVRRTRQAGKALIDADPYATPEEGQPWS